MCGEQGWGGGGGLIIGGFCFAGWIYVYGMRVRRSARGLWEWSERKGSL